MNGWTVQAKTLRGSTNTGVMTHKTKDWANESEFSPISESENASRKNNAERLIEIMYSRN